MAGEVFPTPDIKGYGASPAGRHSEGHRVNRRRFSDVTEGNSHWEKKRLPTPGAQNYAFETLALYELTPIGPGVSQRKFFKVLQPPQNYIPAQALTTTGLGGVAAGQVFFQPLLDPYAGTFGGKPIG